MANDSKETKQGKTKRRRDAPLHIAMNQEEKRTIRIAAAMEGVTMTDFVMERVLPDAKKITSAP